MRNLDISNHVPAPKLWKWTVAMTPVCCCVALLVAIWFPRYVGAWVWCGTTWILAVGAGWLYTELWPETPSLPSRREPQSWGREYEGAPILPPRYASELRPLGQIDPDRIDAVVFWPDEEAGK